MEEKNGENRWRRAKTDQRGEDERVEVKNGENRWRRAKPDQRGR